MARPLLALVMIVKDEAKVIAKTLASVEGVVDHVTVLDTGSTDGTQAAVQRYSRERAPMDEGTTRAASWFVLREASDWYDVFVSYAEARNRALDVELSRGDRAEFSLSLSADEALHGGAALRVFLSSYEGNEDAFLVEIRTPLGSFHYPRVLRTGSPWRYEGEIHEEPRNQGDPSGRATTLIPGCWIEYAPTDRERHAHRLRERDLPGLLAQYRSATADPEARARVALLLAQTRELLAESVRSTDPAAWAQEMCQALGWYLLLVMDESVPADTRARAQWRYLNAAEHLGLYAPAEMLARLQSLPSAAQEWPEVAFKVAVHTAQVSESNGAVTVGDPRRGYRAAVRAAEVARQAVRDPAHPHDPYGLLWRSHHLAATCARAFGDPIVARRSAREGLAAGGAAEAFAEFLPGHTTN